MGGLGELAYPQRPKIEAEGKMRGGNGPARTVSKNGDITVHPSGLHAPCRTFALFSALAVATVSA